MITWTPELIGEGDPPDVAGLWLFGGTWVAAGVVEPEPVGAAATAVPAAGAVGAVEAPPAVVPPVPAVPAGALEAERLVVDLPLVRRRAFRAEVKLGIFPSGVFFCWLEPDGAWFKIGASVPGVDTSTGVGLAVDVVAVVSGTDVARTEKLWDAAGEVAAGSAAGTPAVWLELLHRPWHTAVLEPGVAVVVWAGRPFVADEVAAAVPDVVVVLEESVEVVAGSVVVVDWSVVVVDWSVVVVDWSVVLADVVLASLVVVAAGVAGATAV